MESRSLSSLAASISRKFSGNNVAVGIDVSARSVKAVVLEKDGDKIILKNYAIARSNNVLVEIGNSGVINDFAGNVVAKMLETAGIKKKKVNVAIPSFTSLVITVEVKKIAGENFEESIRGEISKYIPVKIDDVIYDWQVIDEKKLGGGAKDDEVDLRGSDSSGSMMKILVIAVMKEISDKYGEVFSLNDLNIDFLEIDSISLTRALTRSKKGVYLILDIGHNICNILVSSQHSILMSRTIDVGGGSMTGAIATAMGVSLEKAEQLKKEQGINIGVPGQGGNILMPIVTTITDELKKTMELFNSSFESAKIDNVLLTGGSSRMVGLREIIQEQVGMETLIGNALAGIEFDPAVKGSLLKHASSLGIATGLALINIDE